jgi:choline dehydrogenase-like flavoprotein
MNPQSLGTVSLSSSNPSSLAVVDSQLHTHPFDRRVMLDAFSEVLKFFKKTKQYNEGFVRWLNDMDGDLEKVLEEQVLAVWHANGTVRMGETGEEGTCVDGSFKVVGTEGLRVADLSVCPVTIK